MIIQGSIVIDSNNIVKKEKTIAEAKSWDMLQLMALSRYITVLFSNPKQIAWDSEDPFIANMNDNIGIDRDNNSITPCHIRFY
jgi:hypothetical protein